MVQLHTLMSVVPILLPLLQLVKDQHSSCPGVKASSICEVRLLGGGCLGGAHLRCLNAGERRVRGARFAVTVTLQGGCWSSLLGETPW